MRNESQRFKLTSIFNADSAVGVRSSHTTYKSLAASSGSFEHTLAIPQLNMNDSFLDRVNWHDN